MTNHELGAEQENREFIGLRAEAEEFMEVLPEMRAAFESGGDWKERPEWDHYNDSYVYPCDCETRWHTGKRSYGFAVEAGVLVFGEHLWQDDEYDWSEVGPVGDAYAEGYRALTEKQDAENTQLYLAHVAETGEDPADMYVVPSKPRETVNLHVWLRGREFLRAERDGQPWALDADAVKHLDLAGTEMNPRTYDYVVAHSMLTAQPDGTHTLDTSWERRPEVSEEEAQAHYRALALRDLAEDADD